jgi:hypothetical protein
MDEYGRSILGLKNVLGYLEKFAATEACFQPEVERTRLIIAAAERRNGEELGGITLSQWPSYWRKTLRKPVSADLAMPYCRIKFGAPRCC